MKGKDRNVKNKWIAVLKKSNHPVKRIKKKSRRGTVTVPTGKHAGETYTPVTVPTGKHTYGAPCPGATGQICKKE